MVRIGFLSNQTSADVTWEIRETRGRWKETPCREKTLSSTLILLLLARNSCLNAWSGTVTRLFPGRFRWCHRSVFCSRPRSPGRSNLDATAIRLQYERSTALKRRHALRLQSKYGGCTCRPVCKNSEVVYNQSRQSSEDLSEVQNFTFSMNVSSSAYIQSHRVPPPPALICDVRLTLKT